jgi:hypothetical protein
LSPDLKEELKEHLNTFNFSGSGGEMRDVITFQGLIILSMYLPGPHAKRNRAGIALIAHRYFAGDKRLIEEIIQNAVSTEPAAVMARQELDVDSDDDGYAALYALRLEREARATKLLEADLAVREGQMQLQKQQAALAAKQAALADRQAALLSKKFPHSEENAQRLQRIQAGMAEQRLVRMQLDNIVRAKKLAKDMDAELLVISASDAAETDKAQAMDRVRAFYAQLHCLEFPTAPKARAEGATNCKQQLMDFLLAFLADSHNLSHNTTITASKFYEAYLLFEDAHKPPIRMSATMFGREIRTVHGVSKRRCTNGWVYTLDHTAMH